MQLSKTQLSKCKHGYLLFEISERGAQIQLHLSGERFSESESITIEHFILMHKIEIVKKLITKDKLTLTEIASKLNYSSVAHLSNQFKN